MPLLERAGRRVRLTPAAERLVEHTEAIHLSDLPGSPARRIYAATRRGASQQPALAAVSQALATSMIRTMRSTG